MSPDSGDDNANNNFLLELTLISAQDLFPSSSSSSRPLRTYAVTYLHPSRRLRTRIDSSTTPTSPSWNEKFVFRVDSPTLLSPTSSLQIDIYASRPRFLPSPDILLGTARALLSTLLPSPSTQFFALQIRRPSSLRPQGILNIAVGIADPYVGSLNLRASAFSYHDLMDAATKTRKNGADPPRLPQLRPVVVDRSGSLGEKERVVVERKLKKWRSEIWEAGTDDESSRKEKTRRPRAMSCFNLAGQFAGEIEEDDDSSLSSWSSNSQR